MNKNMTTKSIMKKHREIIATYIKCKQCGEIDEEKTCRVYLEDSRYMVDCVRCGFKEYLKTHHS
jgi:Zn ribbon nucleic-acid-binding protein